MKIQLLGIILLFGAQMIGAQPLNSHPQINFVCNKGNYVVSEMADNFFPGDDLSTMCIPKSNGIPNGYWYAWTIDHPGEVEFVIKPKNPEDDIDFEMYLLTPEEELRIVRCMATGPNMGESENEPCLGITGMISSSRNIKETIGCDEHKTNFTTPIYTVKNQTYLLRIINFSAKEGFEIEISGSAHLKGQFDSEVIYEKDDKRFYFDAEISLRENEISNMHWDFGTNAIPSEWNGLTPPVVRYSSKGQKNILLEVQGNLGCKDQAQLSIEVDGRDVVKENNELLTAFPNPFLERVTIAAKNSISTKSEIKIQVWDSKGLLVHQEEVEDLSTKEFDFKTFSAGTYLMRITSENLDETIELIKINNQGN